MNILMTGGTGFIGRALVNSLLKEGHKVTVLSRTPDSVNKIIGNKLTTLSNLDQLNSEHSFQVIINLAGAPIFDNHWSETRKKVIRDSRIKLTEQLLAYIERI